MAAIEFALVSLIMFVWIFGMMEVARAFWTYQILQEVAIQGARCMGVLATGCSSGGAYSASATQSYIAARASALGLTLPAADIVATHSTSCAGTSGFSTVAISYRFTTTMPILIPSLSSITLHVSSCYYDTR